MTPRAFAVLRHLVEHAGRLVTKDELFTTVWGDTIVSEAALTSCIRDLRRALGDSSRTPRYIETVHRRGFRFIGPVAAARGPDASDAPKPARPPHRSRALRRWSGARPSSRGCTRVFASAPTGSGSSSS